MVRCAVVRTREIFVFFFNFAALVLPLTIVLVVTCSTIVGSLLPLMFDRLGFDPALMSTPFIAGISDIVGLVLYMNVVGWLLHQGV